MTVHIAIPEPTSLDPSYNDRSLRPYLDAIEAGGATPAVIPLRESPDCVIRGLSRVQGILFPGSRYDISPQTYGEESIPECAAADPARVMIDALLLEEAFRLEMPILAVCYGLQALNVWRGGSLYQDLDKQVGKKVDHSPGSDVGRAHLIEIAPQSRLAALVGPGTLWVNSSHHQAILRVGDGLLVTALSPVDGVIEAVELDSADHFVVGVQWHPERTVAESSLSRGLFAALLQAAQGWAARRIEEPVARG